jgi:hypothetical protein
MPSDFAISVLLTLFIVVDPVGLLVALPGRSRNRDGALP